MKVEYFNRDLDTMWGVFPNGNTSLILIDKNDDDEIFTTSTNPNNVYPEKIIALRSDNKELQNSLLRNNIIQSEPVAVEPSGMIYLSLYRLSDEAYQEMIETKTLNMQANSKEGLLNKIEEIETRQSNHLKDDSNSKETKREFIN